MAAAPQGHMPNAGMPFDPNAVPSDETLAADLAGGPIVMDGLNMVVSTVQTYGWLLVGACALMVYVASRLRPSLQRWQQQREDSAYKKQDVNTASSRVEAMMQARQKMQAELDAQAAVHKALMAEKEEKKRLEKIDDYDKMQQGKSKVRAPPTSSKDKPKKSLRGDTYSPLGGSGGDSCGWRPSRRAGPSGGG